jgi:N-acetylglucosaminyl-diphospho-decaprenol L-rhamnosyltransferase
MLQPEMESPWDRVSVISGLFHSMSILPEFFENMLHARYIILSDGGSTDETVSMIHRLRPDATVLTNEVDPGVPSIYNQCIRAAKTEYVLQINPDAKITTKCLAGLVRILDDNPGAAAAAPKIIQGHEAKIFPEIDVMGPNEHFHQKISTLPDGPFCTWFVTGAVVLWRRLAFDDFGFLDETFFFYGDDLDICIRATRKGWSIILDPSLEARHVGAGSSGSSGSFSKEARWLKAWNMTWAHLRIVDKYEGSAAAWKVAKRMERENIQTALKYTLLMNFKKKVSSNARVDAAQKYLRGDPWWGKPNLPQSN